MSVSFYMNVCTSINSETSHFLFIIWQCVNGTEFPLRLSFLRIHNSFRIHPYGLQISGDFLPFFSEKEIVRNHIKIGKDYTHHSTQKLITSKLCAVSPGRGGDLCTDLDSQLCCQLSQRLRINELLQWVNTDTEAVQGLFYSSWCYSAPLIGYEASQEENWNLKSGIYLVVNDPEGLLGKTQILNYAFWKRVSALFLFSKKSWSPGKIQNANKHENHSSYVQAKGRTNKPSPPKCYRHIPCPVTTPLELETEMQNRLQNFISIIMAFAALPDTIKMSVLVLQCQEKSSLYFSLPLCYSRDFNNKNIHSFRF